MSYKVPCGLVLVLLVLCSGIVSPALCAGASDKGAAPLRGRLARLLHPFEVLEERLKLVLGDTQQQQEQTTISGTKSTQGLVIDTEIELEDFQAPSLPRALKQVPVFTPEPSSAPSAQSSQGSYGTYGSYGETQSGGYSGPSRRLSMVQSTEGDESDSGYGNYGGYGHYGSRHLLEYANDSESYGARRQLLMEGEGGGYGGYGYGGYEG
jgi:hypothetical protein